jgi:hypothetical protein
LPPQARGTQGGRLIFPDHLPGSGPYLRNLDYAQAG